MLDLGIYPLNFAPGVHLRALCRAISDLIRVFRFVCELSDSVV